MSTKTQSINTTVIYIAGNEIWCPEGDLNPHDRLWSADFKSAVSADFTIRAARLAFPILSHEADVDLRRIAGLEDWAGLNELDRGCGTSRDCAGLPAHSHGSRNRGSTQRIQAHL
jgi:hypothetical protein